MKACLIFHGLVGVDLVYQCLKSNLPDNIQFNYFNIDCLTDDKGFWHPEWVMSNEITEGYDGVVGRLIHNFHWIMPLFLVMYKNYKKGKDIFYDLERQLSSLGLDAKWNIDKLNEVRKNVESRLEMHGVRNCSVVGIQVTYRSELDFLFTLFWLKKNNPMALVVCGGKHFSTRPELRKMLHMTNLIDTIVIGDGELAFPWLIDKWQKRHDLPFEVSMPMKMSDIDELPIGRQTEYRKKGLLVYNDNEIKATKCLHIYTTKGCSNDCSFCTVSDNMRIVKTEKVVDAIERIYIKYGASEVYFADSLSGYSKKRFYDIHNEMRKRGLLGKIKISFAYFTPKVLLDGGIINEIAPSLSLHIHTGIESFCQDILERMNKKHTAEESIKVAQMLHKYGNATLGRMLCFPGETEKQFDYQLEMFLKYLPAQSGKYFYNFHLFPYTDVYTNPDKYNIRFKYFPPSVEDVIPEMGEIVRSLPIDWIDLTDEDGSVWKKKTDKLRKLNARQNG
jgi:hypothetical protein